MATSATSPAPSRIAAPTPELQLEVERFLYREAMLLDRHAFGEWFELLADDLRYVMPATANRAPVDGGLEYSPERDAAFFDETKASVAVRLKRLRTGQAWAELPVSRTRHLVTNVLVEPAAAEGEYRVDSCFLVYRSRLERQVDVFAGGRVDRLRRTAKPAGFEIAERTIHLDQATLLANNLSIFF